MSKKSFLLSLILLLAGCHAAEVTMYSSQRYPPSKFVEVFSDLATIKQEYFEIGQVEAKGGLTVTKQQLLDDMKEKAQIAGAHALIKVEFYDRERYDPKLGSYSKPAAKAVMVRYVNVQ